MMPSLMPISALMIPSIGSRIRTFVMTWSRAPFAWVVPGLCPIPSLTVFPPPKTSSSPYVVKSCSTSTIRFVSASWTLSPTVGP